MIPAATAATLRASTRPERPLPAEEPKLLVAVIAGASASTFCMYALDRSSVWGIPEAASPASISACQRRRAIGESAEALLVALTTWPAPALAALATTLSSWGGTAGLTSTTPLI